MSVRPFEQPAEGEGVSRLVGSQEEGEEGSEAESGRNIIPSPCSLILWRMRIVAIVWLQSDDCNIYNE
jgi:hypothetical protein